MFCYNCGYKYEDNQVVCPKCGTVLENKENKEEKKNTEIADESILYIVLSVLSLFVCNQITGVIGLIFAILGCSEYGKGNYVTAKEHWKVCKITLLIGVAITVGIILMVFSIWGFAIFGTLAALF